MPFAQNEKYDLILQKNIDIGVFLGANILVYDKSTCKTGFAVLANQNRWYKATMSFLDGVITKLAYTNASFEKD